MEAARGELHEPASPCSPSLSASRETSEAPLLSKPSDHGPPAFLETAATLEEGLTSTPHRAPASQGDNCRRGLFAGSAALAVLGLMLLGVAAWAPDGAPEKRPQPAPGAKVIGLNVLMAPTTRAPPAEEEEPSTSAPLRPPPDFAIEPPPGFYPDLPTPATPDSVGSAARNPMLRAASTTPVKEADWTGEMAPLRPPPDFAIPPPPDSPMSMGREPGALPERGGGLPVLRAGRGGEGAVKSEDQDWTLKSVKASAQTFDTSKERTAAGGWAADVGIAGAAGAAAPARRIEDLEALKEA